jgi:glutamine phosphoribosylpyrophosphate amidotransferase
MCSVQEFIANNLTDEEVGRVLGADMLIYQVCNCLTTLPSFLSLIQMLSTGLMID